MEGEKDVFDLNKNWFMMFAEGPAVNGKADKKESVFDSKRLQ